MEVKFFDIHAHLNFKVFQNPEEKIKENLSQGVWFLNIGTCKSTSKEAVRLALFDGVWAGIGLHPHHTWSDLEDPFEGKIEKEEFFDEDFYESLINEKTLVIGEFGLDYFYFDNLSADKIKEIKKRQWDVCESQIVFAKKHKKSLMIHLRSKDESAFEDFYSLVKKYLPIKANIHFFSGSKEYAKKFLDLGFYLSFGGVITFKNANEKREVLSYVPLERILTETDSPYVSPEPLRGTLNEPKNVKVILEKIAQIKNVDFEVAKETIFKNSIDYLGLNQL